MYVVSSMRAYLCNALLTWHFFPVSVSPPTGSSVFAAHRRGLHCDCCGDSFDLALLHG